MLGDVVSAHTSFVKNQVSEDLDELDCFLESSFVTLCTAVSLCDFVGFALALVIVLGILVQNLGSWKDHGEEIII